MASRFWDHICVTKRHFGSDGTGDTPPAQGGFAPSVQRNQRPDRGGTGRHQQRGPYPEQGDYSRESPGAGGSLSTGARSESNTRLSRHCKVAKSRAYEIIAIAEGRTTEDEINDRKNEKRSPAAAARSVRVRGQSVKQLPDQRSPEDVERSTLMSTIHSKLERLSSSHHERRYCEADAEN